MAAERSRTDRACLARNSKAMNAGGSVYHATCAGGQGQGRSLSAAIACPCSQVLTFSLYGPLRVILGKIVNHDRPWMPARDDVSCDSHAEGAVPSLLLQEVTTPEKCLGMFLTLMSQHTSTILECLLKPRDASLAFLGQISLMSMPLPRPARPQFWEAVILFSISVLPLASREALSKSFT